MTAISWHKIESGYYEARVDGKRVGAVTRSDEHSDGYWGRWRGWYRGEPKWWTDSMRNAKAYVEARYRATRPYVTVMPAAPRSGWKVMFREGDVITHRRLENASIHEPEKARAAAAKMFPDHLVVLPDDPNKPWKATR